MDKNSILEILIDSIKVCEIKYTFDKKAFRKVKELFDFKPADIMNFVFKNKSKQKYYNMLNNSVLLTEKEAELLLIYLNSLKEGVK